MECPSTQWSLLAKASRDGDAAGTQALAEFHRQYRGPVLAFIAQRGISTHDAEDLAQGFFVHPIEKATLRRADATRGRFRSFLLGALVRFLAHARDRKDAARRGGGAVPLSLDTIDGADNEPALPAADVHAYDRDRAVQLLQRALETVETDFASRGRAADFAVLRAYLPGTVQAAPNYEESAARPGLTLASFKTEVHRLRARGREVLRREIAATVSSPEEIDDEVACLGPVLQSTVA